VNKRPEAGEQHATSQRAAERLEAAADAEFLDKANDDLYGRDDDAPDATDATDAPDAPDTTDPTGPDGARAPDDAKSLKRKEPAEDETSPKRQCPEILIE
jgi:hypothetical protein